MVGYNENDIGVNQKLIAGCFAGCFTKFLTQPMDVIKIRVQLQRKTGEELFSMDTLRKRIYKEEGIRAFWQGHTLGQIHSVIAVGSQFYVYECLSKYVAVNYGTHRYKNILNYMCGAAAGSISCILICPLEVVRVRQMLGAEKYQGLLPGARAVYRTGGAIAFYEGLTASLIQITPATGASFAVFHAVQGFLIRNISQSIESQPQASQKPDAKTLLISSTLAGSVAGVFSKSLVYPFDLAKRRLQIGSHKPDKCDKKIPETSCDLVSCKRLFGCLTHAYRTEGIRGLYRGWSITILKAQLTSVIAFTTYELSCYGIKELDSTIYR